MEAITSAVSFVDTDTGRTYKVKLVPENQQTDDASGRFIVGPVSWRAGRIPFTFSDVEGFPHEEARHVGNLDNLRREIIDGSSWIVGDLDWDDDELAVEARRLVDEERITGVSIHPTDGESVLVCGVPVDTSEATIRRQAEQFDFETCEDVIEVWFNLIVGSATLLMLPAFEDAEVVTASNTFEPARVNGIWTGANTNSIPWNVELRDINGDPVTAAAPLDRPPAEWFERPELDGPTYVTVTDEGRVFGTLAPPDVCHRGFLGECVLPPPDAANFEEFHDNASVMLANGQLLRVGCLTVDVSHADQRKDSESAKRHYDHSGTVVAFVRAGQDQNGIWVAGALAPWATEDQIEKLRRLRLSGDWRPTRDGRHFLIAAQVVPVPGFPIRAKVADGMLASYTTLSPEPPDAVDEASELALVASAVEHLINEVRELRVELAAERRQRAYDDLVAPFRNVDTTVYYPTIQ